MSLLKSLQQKLTTEFVRFINQIVVDEKSDLDQNGNATSHFELYFRAMEEVGAPIAEIRKFLLTQDLEDIPAGARDFVRHNLDVPETGMWWR